MLKSVLSPSRSPQKNLCMENKISFSLNAEYEVGICAVVIIIILGEIESKSSPDFVVFRGGAVSRGRNLKTLGRRFQV